MSAVARRAGVQTQAIGLAVKTSGRTGERTFYVGLPHVPRWKRTARRRLLDHAARMLETSGAAPGAAVFVDTPDRHGRVTRKEMRCR